VHVLGAVLLGPGQSVQPVEAEGRGMMAAPAIFDPVDPGQFAAACAHVANLQAALEKSRQENKDQGQGSSSKGQGEQAVSGSPAFCPGAEKRQGDF
jgi:hypothetical protein